MLPLVDRTPEELNEALERRMESFVSDLLVTSGMTQRGAILSKEFRETRMPAICRFALRILAALEGGEAAVHPWDRGDRNAA